ncbi:N-6 DNA methylase [Beutenbergia cavernae DSM 12333]|uniref:site-specific DNA-methyltransferase (adenine-specific) n=1 Tax=Beutenbergia cavernae (strain ATCC BAA-8 / DSM 12333 / CCUG 43141 / JCM 11478 / NBRC 16432 / NCIMB 13614 / HKI 0122) TaxID=471853 RepID=C5C4N2_BEUC1|nr:class I SAM-dependent DNA methyltransferase [Beutenbergia cavernae]ACQ82156.1 N-6 DNA methylase [Beutenbergia cavernae DSM 12333]
MPPRRKRAEALPTAATTMKELKDTLWKAADKLRGSMDASQYKDVILGLVFLKYVSDAFDERRAVIAAELAADGIGEEQAGPLLEEVDEYRAAGVFWVPPRARWGYLAQHAKGRPAGDPEGQATIGELVDEAMVLIMGTNPALATTLPQIFNKENVDQRRLGELIDLFNSARFTGDGARKARDVLGEVYEYFLGKFAAAEGKRGGEFYTPPGVVRVLVEVLEPYRGRVYDPCCGSGGMFVQAEKFIERHGEDPQAISVYGQELNERTWRMAKMNLAVHGLTAQLGPRWGDTFARDVHPDVQMDFVMANPPFNIKDWARNAEDARWKFGVPPAGNANYAWIQHILSKLAPGGSAGVVMANGSMSSNSVGEGEIRAALVEVDLVSCMVALPTQLFRSTGIPVCVWFFAKSKAAGASGSVDRTGQVLFIDARNLGHMVTRAERELSDEDIARIAGTFHAWRGAPSASGASYEDVPGFCYSATLSEIKEAGYALAPGRYVGAPEVEDDGEPIEEKIERLTAELFAQFEESARLEQVVREQLGRVRG